MKKKLLVLALALAFVGACSFTGPKVAFNLPNINGTQFDSAVNAKKQPVFLAFMATYCGYCKMSVPMIVELQNNFGSKGLKVVGVFSDGSADGPAAYAKEFGINYDVLYQGGQLAQEAKVNGVPHFVLLNKNHQIVRVWSGYSPDHNFAEEIQKVL
ncbi:Redoxin domain protein [Elusimicrobium minutum Pei191]|uniref:Redoxin domain protein n=1 Tax=Elusimicrobium minutum (strain Pei191) TaxID=445932 RepID=B2KE85_ELUMP|nr:TlpA disulfide reductase family protein [Elusimicrobium minutum]ACC98831.1 Redoxin domain protein [Elusimicrobium minutum Pei191]